MSAPFNGQQCPTCGTWLRYEYCDEIRGHPVKPRMRAACQGCNAFTCSMEIGMAYTDYVGSLLMLLLHKTTCSCCV